MANVKSIARYRHRKSLVAGNSFPKTRKVQIERHRNDPKIRRKLEKERHTTNKQKKHHYFRLSCRMCELSIYVAVHFESIFRCQTHNEN